MDKHKTEIIFTIIVSSIFTYLLGIIVSSCFVIYLEMDSDYCVKWNERYESVIYNDEEEKVIRYDCIMFKNSFEEAKYYHNKLMNKRHSIISWFVIISGFLFSCGLFYIAVKLTDHGYYGLCSFNKDCSYFINREKYYRELGNEIMPFAVVVGTFSSFMIPVLFGLLLPEPFTYFPDFIVECNDAQVNHWLNEFKN